MAYATCYLPECKGEVQRASQVPWLWRPQHREAQREAQRPCQGGEDQLMKSKSFCNNCGEKGHWHKDPECPNNAQGVRDVEVCHHVPAEVISLRHDGGSLVGITDTACAKAVAGTAWLQSYSATSSARCIRSPR